jgi:hypothetical protein
MQPKFRAWEPPVTSIGFGRMYRTAYPTFNGGIVVWKNDAPQTETEILEPWANKEPVLMQYVEILDAYEGDILQGIEINEYGSLQSKWTGIVKYNEDKGRIMIQDDLNDWYEVDDFEFDEVIGNIYQTPTPPERSDEE